MQHYNCNVKTTLQLKRYNYTNYNATITLITLQLQHFINPLAPEEDFDTIIF